MNILHNGAITLHHGDCLDVMHEIPDRSVDAIICDLPYGTTDCAWDSVIPFEPMWAALKRIIKPKGAIVLFGSQPFTSALVMSNPKWFKYDWVWNKSQSSNPQLAKIQPLRITENISIFGEGRLTYNPQGLSTDVEAVVKRRGKWQTTIDAHRRLGHINVSDEYQQMFTNYPKNIITIPTKRTGVLHPTQKPVALLEYLIRTYTNEGETVLDFTFGSCTAGVAALTTKRRFIGIERDATYYALGVQRVQTAIDNLPPMDV